MGHSEGSPETKFIVIQAYLKKIETFQINNLHLHELEEQQQRKPRASRRKEIIKIKAELNDIEIKRTIQRINKSRSWLFEKDKQNQKIFKQTHQEKTERGPK